jgi:hypothetical protein
MDGWFTSIVLLFPLKASFGGDDQLHLNERPNCLLHLGHGETADKSDTGEAAMAVYLPQDFPHVIVNRQETRLMTVRTFKNDSLRRLLFIFHPLPRWHDDLEGFYRRSTHKKRVADLAGNPAVCLRPVAFRPCLTTGLALLIFSAHALRWRELSFDRFKASPIPAGTKQY